ncbi:MAG TPA: hypothetical protein ENN60_01810 [archaeon]|nr:hypothetical protein [archaeon]
MFDESKTGFEFGRKAGFVFAFLLATSLLSLVILPGQGWFFAGGLVLTALFSGRLIKGVLA